MKQLTFLPALTFVVSKPLVFAEHEHFHADQPAASAGPDAIWLAKAKAEYPLKTCVVSEEEIGGSMGEGFDYVYQQEGRPDWLVRFFCKNCRKDFNKDPALYLNKIDEAATKAKKN